MSFSRWDPLEELKHFREQTDRLWDSFLQKWSESAEGATSVGFLPEIDVVETREDVRVYVSVPGMLEEDIEVLPTSTSLTIRGERESPYDPQRNHVREWRYGYFERRLELPVEVDITRVKASCEAGVLIVILGKGTPDE